MGGGSSRSTDSESGDRFDTSLVVRRDLEVDSLPSNARWHDDKKFAADGTLVFDARSGYQ